MSLFHALIRTHHITSRKKVAHLRKAAGKFDCYALLRSGGCPGIMYCKGSEEAVREWVGTVQRLRYKDFQLVFKPGPIVSKVVQPEPQNGLFEVEAVKEFAAAMENRGILNWWERGMGFK